MKKSHTEDKNSKTKKLENDPAEVWNGMSSAEKEARIDFLWNKARTHNSKLRF
jgi:hypothetical protein